MIIQINSRKNYVYDESGLMYTGASSKVYKATDSSCNRTVCLKVTSYGGTKTTSAMLKAEALALGNAGSATTGVPCLIEYYDDISKLLNIYSLLKFNGRISDEIIINKNNEIITYYENKPHILLKKSDRYFNKITLNEIINYDCIVYKPSESNWKNLWTQNGNGNPLDVYRADNEYDEAEFIANQIQKANKEGSRFADCAILYRTNAQSRVIETTLSGHGIPYRVLAGLRFYDRKEVKDALSYLRLIQNPSDNISLLRVVNEPARKIGVATLEKVSEVARQKGLCLFSVLEAAEAGAGRAGIQRTQRRAAGTVH